MLQIRPFNQLTKRLVCNYKLNVRCFSSNQDDKGEKSTISQNIEEDLKKLKEVRKDLANNDSLIYNEYKQQEKGFIYDKRPIKVKCKKGKIYMWCACGHSKHQPFCDGTHRIAHYKITLKPFPFTAKEDKEYWFCNCKQSNNRPLCDGTHKEDFVQNAKSTMKY